MKWETRWTWNVWVFGFGLDLEQGTAGICFGPWAGWLVWGDNA